MKKQWTEKETCMVLLTIMSWLNERVFVTKDGELPYIPSIGKMEQLLGLPYTSSGRCAGVYITNTILYLDVHKIYHVYGFEMDERGTVVAVCFDNEENELLIPINI